MATYFISGESSESFVKKLKELDDSAVHLKKGFLVRIDESANIGAEQFMDILNQGPKVKEFSIIQLSI